MSLSIKQRTELQLLRKKEGGEGWTGSQGLADANYKIYTYIMDKQQGPIV